MSSFKVAALVKLRLLQPGGWGFSQTHLCFVSVCVSRLMEVGSELRVGGHYLQPERCASASSFSPSSLPAV